MIDLGQSHQKGVGLVHMPAAPPDDGTMQARAHDDSVIKKMHPSRIARIRAMSADPTLAGRVSRQFGLSQYQLRVILDDTELARVLGPLDPVQIGKR